MNKLVGRRYNLDKKRGAKNLLLSNFRNQDFVFQKNLKFAFLSSFGGDIGSKFALLLKVKLLGLYYYKVLKLFVSLL